MDEVINRMVQIGIVSAISGNKVKAMLPGTGITSDWLYVIQRTDEIVNTVIVAAGSHTHELTLSEGSGAASTAPDHTHTATSKVASWLPKVGEKVLVLYLPVYGSDGFVLGRIL